jgi:hypothetical protein
MKRILILSDFHSGHRYGLAHAFDCVNQEQKRAWRFFSDGINKYAPCDVVLANGDLIDGNAKKNGGVELITTDRFEQARMAIRILNQIKDCNGNRPIKWMFTYGTPFHTGTEEDFEQVIAKEFKAPIADTLLYTAS